MIHDGKFASGRFCSIECANTRTHSQATRQKIGAGVRVPREVRQCLQCGVDYSTYYDDPQKYCSVKCTHLHRTAEFRKDWSAKKEYKANCQFRFSLKQHSELFDFVLLNKHGWYHPVKNPEGVSRDHMLSITDGYAQNIPASIISHPCNCVLIQHNDNRRKNANSSISYTDLLEKIKCFDSSIVEHVIETHKT